MIRRGDLAAYLTSVRRRRRRANSQGADILIGDIENLSAELDGADVVLNFAPATNATSYEYRWGLLNPPTDGAAQPLDDDTADAEPLPDDVTVYFQVRGRSGESVGNWSNVSYVDTPEVAPTLLTLPSFTGTLQEDELLTANVGTWTGSPSSYAYRWFADGVAIGGATASTFTLTDTQIGADISVGVIATNGAGSSSEAVSGEQGPVEAAPGGPTYDTDATAAFARMSTQPSADHKQAISDLITALKGAAAGNLWTGLHSLVIPMKTGIGDQWINLVGNYSNPSVANGAPTFDASVGGYALDGVDDVIALNINPEASHDNFPQNTWGFGIDTYVNEQSDNSLGLFYNATVNGSHFAIRTSTNGTSFRLNQVALTQVSSGVTTSLLRRYYNRSGASATQIYNGGTQLSPTSNSNQASVAHPDGSWELGRITTGGTITGKVGHVRGFYSWKDTRTIGNGKLTQMEAALAAYETAFLAL